MDDVLRKLNNQDQISLIQDFKSFLEKYSFDANDLNYSSSLKALQELTVRAKNIFGLENARAILLKIDNNSLDIVTRTGGGGGGEPQADCGCSQSNDWCQSPGKCESERCTVSSWGCGTLWWYKCDGKCKLFND